MALIKCSECGNVSSESEDKIRYYREKYYEITYKLTDYVISHNFDIKYIAGQWGG